MTPTACCGTWWPRCTTPTAAGTHTCCRRPATPPPRSKKKLYVSPFNEVDGHYLVRAPRPEATVDVTISLHREHKPAFVATLQGSRRSAGTGQVLRLQLVAPVAPLMGALWIRIQGITLWARRVPVVPRDSVAERERVDQL